MIDVYFIQRGKGECIGAVSLKEYDPLINAPVWQTYTIYIITDKTLLFKRTEKEFCVVDGFFKHEMGNIKIKYINGWVNVNVIEVR